MERIEQYLSEHRRCTTYTQIEYACHDCRFDVVKFLVLKFNVNVSVRNEFLGIASKHGSLEIVKFLVERGSGVNDISVYTYTPPVFDAIVNKQTHVVEYLLENGGNLDLVCALAAAKSTVGILRLCMKFPVLLNDMFSIACEFGILENVEFLFSRGADVRHANDRALRISAKNGHIKVVKYLVRVGANIRENNDEAIRMSSLNEHFEIVMYLISMGADRMLIHPKSERYIQLYERTRHRAQKKIYFWWIPICYSLIHPSGCGKRMMQKNWEQTQKLLIDFFN